VSRADELADGLAEVQARIDRACAAAGRDRADVVLVAVTKTWPAEDVVALAGLGVTEVGENRDDEASAKVREVRAAGVGGLRWHMVGQVQSRKARSVAGWADVVHSLDRARLATALGAGACDAGRTVDVLVQVSLDGDPGRGGALPADVPALAATAAGTAGLRLAGVMAVAPRGSGAAAAFSRLAEVSALLRADHPEAVVISAGMSGDLEAAVAAGATHLRVGTALLGRRPPLLR
jgi:PLP dependent protein